MCDNRRGAGRGERAGGHGPNLRALAVYLVVYQHVPVERAAQLIADVCGAGCSTGWISSVLAATAEALVDVEVLIKTAITAAGLVHVDETSLNINGGKQWLHVACTDNLTAYHLHESPGGPRSTSSGSCPAIRGSSYTTPCRSTTATSTGPRHTRCGAHLARELVAAAETHFGQAWPKAALDALYGLNDAAHAAREQGLRQIPPETAEALLENWRHAILCGLAAHPRRDGRKQSKTRNLLERLRGRDEQALRFGRDLAVPFTNNQAERDLRRAKTQLKISGCHRSSTGAQAWLRIRSYISTARKHGINMLTPSATPSPETPGRPPQPPPEWLPLGDR